MKLPVARTPDFSNFLAVLHRERPARPTLYELFLNARLYRTCCDPALADLWRPENSNLDRHRVIVSAFARLGYDYAAAHVGLGFPRKEHRRAQSLSQNDAVMFTDRAGFTAYPWPDVDRFDYSALDGLLPHLPAKMKLVPLCPGGVLENVTGMLGFENMCLMAYDDPELLADVFAAVGKRLVRHVEILARHPAVGALVGNDDWGHRTQTMLSPELMRRYVFPWHRLIVEAAHQQGKPILLHSCGNLAQVMDDIVELGYDAKHSYEDAICPVETMYDRWSGKIAVLGGIDVDFICRGELAAVTARAKAMLERARERGGYALGTGNSVPEYIEDERYFAMTRAALE